MLAVTLSLAMLAVQNPGARVDSVMRAEMKRRFIPGAAVVVVRNGQVVKTGVYGKASLELDVPVTPRTRFQIASATKNFTSVAVFRLVRDGKVRLDDPITQHLSGLPAAWAPVTIREAMSHTSGLPDLIVDPMNGATLKGSWDSVVTQLASMPVKAPGLEWSYNQTNYALLGKLVEKYRGMSFTDYMKAFVFRPLGMTSAAFGDSRAVLPGKTTEYSKFQVTGPVRSLGDLVVAPYTYPDFLFTAAGIFLDIGDMGRWLVALERGKLLDQEAVAECSKPVALADGKPFKFDSGPTSYDLGWVVLDREPHRAFGGSGGARSAYFYYPKDRLAVAVLTNLQGASPEDLVEAIAKVYLPDLAAIKGG